MLAFIWNCVNHHRIPTRNVPVTARYRGILVRAVPIPVITAVISQKFSPLPQFSRGFTAIISPWQLSTTQPTEVKHQAWHVVKEKTIYKTERHRKIGMEIVPTPPRKVCPHLHPSGVCVCVYPHTHTRLTALCQGLPGWDGTRKVKPIWIYWSKKQWVAVASAGPYANLHIAPDKQPCQHPITQFFTERMPFLPPNQQCQSTEGNYTERYTKKLNNYL